MNDPEKKQLIENYISSYNSFDIDGMIANLHSEIEFLNISNGEETARASGLVEFKNLAEQAKSLFTDRNQTILASETDRKKTTITISYKAVLAVDLPNGLKAGQKIYLRGKSEFKFKDGKISKIIDIS